MTNDPPPHARAAIVAIGDELVDGNGLDTNSQRIATRLAELAIRTTEHATVADDPHAVRATLHRLCAANDLIVCTGGLGPTQDDLTRDALAALLGDELVQDEKQHRRLSDLYKSRGRSMVDSDRQALRPASAEMLDNDHGTAPGILATIDRDGNRTDCALLPGPPNEMLPMLEARLIPRLRTRAHHAIAFRAIQHFGLGESDAARILETLLDRDRAPLVGITASDGVITTRIRYEGPPDGARTALDGTDAAIAQKLGAYRIGVDAEAIERTAIDALVRSNAALVAAESCTGGLFSARFTEFSGVSRVFLGGWITYANAHKVDHLGVDPRVLAAHGAVSSHVAEAMARGALRHAPPPPDRVERVHAVSITGIAGPGGATVEARTGEVVKPVGTVFIGHALGAVRSGAVDADGAEVRVRRFAFPGDRARVRARSASTAAALVVFGAQGREVPSPMLWEVPPAVGPSRAAGEPACR